MEVFLDSPTRLHGPRYTLNGRLVGPQNWLRRFVEDKRRPILTVLRIPARFLGFVSAFCKNCEKKGGIINFVVSVCPRGTTQLPLDGFS